MLASEQRTRGLVRIVDSSDTFKRSCDHWSKAKKSEMEDFYALASIDYKHLAEAIDWKTWFETIQSKVGLRCIRLLDIACGSGKFPMALASHAHIAEASIKTVDYSLLDPSKFSLSEARQALAAPFKASAQFEMRLQDLKFQSECYDIIWATHALYAIPKQDLELALRCFVSAIRGSDTDKNNGSGFIAHADVDSHYLKFYEHYLKGFKKGVGTPYTDSKQIINILEKLGMTLKIRKITYKNEAPESMKFQVERYLQRCLFDDTLSLEEMMDNSITGPYLKTCRKVGIWQFGQSVSMIFINYPTS